MGQDCCCKRNCDAEGWLGGPDEALRSLALTPLPRWGGTSRAGSRSSTPPGSPRGAWQQRRRPSVDSRASSVDSRRSSVGSRRRSSTPEATRIVLEGYAMHMAEDVVGEGQFSICRRGTNLKTSETVAIKVYKTERPSRRRVAGTKFTRQIAVLQELMAPLQEPADKTLWCEHLGRAGPENLFVQLIDYSRGSSGGPGPDPGDGDMYVVTEMAECSLLDYILQRHGSAKNMSKETVRVITRAMMTVTAGLHAKGFVHLDLKPENLMLFNGVLKLIDVDGCIRIGTRISITDSSLSFSPCYSSPEFARFILDDSPEPHIIARPGLDVWSIGMSIAELVTGEPILKPAFVRLLRRDRSLRKANVLLMEWLSSVTKVPIPNAVECFDGDLSSLLADSLLVADPTRRRTLAESLDHPFVRCARLTRSPTSPLTFLVDEPVPRRRERREVKDHCALHVGVLWKLSRSKDPGMRDHWYKRDVWLSADGSLCYKSLQSGKQLVLIDGHQLANAGLALFKGGAIEPAIQITIFQDDHDEHETHAFGCASQEDCAAWMNALESAMNMVTMKLGCRRAVLLREFRLNINNRRIRVEHDDSGDHVPVFKAMLWKLKQDTDRSDSKNWLEREMWISQNGSLVYFSVREDRELVYYSASDLASATVVALDSTGSCKKWGFRVQLPAQGGVEFTPAEFAADSEELRAEWIQAVCRPGIARGS